MNAALSHLVGQSPAFRRALDVIERSACFEAPVLLRGETGTGKELAARAIHYLGVRRNAPFVPLNCGAVPEALVESELFGAERGAFTDAHTRRTGLIATAEGGTLFLDEVDALPARAQVSLLRFLQDQTYRPLGASREMTGNVRIVAAASPRLESMIAQGGFRADLAFRLDVLSIELPPLRERTGDALLLAEHFAQRFARRYGMTSRRLGAASRAWLGQHGWPGNVRELENRIHRATLLCQGAELDLLQGQGGDFEHAPVATHYRTARDAAMAAWERAYLAELLRTTQGNVTRAAELAGKERRALGKLLKKHGIDRASLGLQTA
ncbi:MAG: sigma-54 dependent transcriptional regulator [Moraxellaceae bacterium]|nr:sigma-54 dependent transcriptional regulator [Moraxellaceae bacterium]